MLMKEYRIKITGEYDVIVLSPNMIARLIDKIRGSDTKEIVIPAEEILPQGYAEYLNRVLQANRKIGRTLTDRNAYSLIAKQLGRLQYEEQDCMERVEACDTEGVPKFDMDVSEGFYIVTKQENNRFSYVFQTDTGEEASIILEYQQM